MPVGTLPIAVAFVAMIALVARLMIALYAAAAHVMGRERPVRWFHFVSFKRIW